MPIQHSAREKASVDGPREAARESDHGSREGLRTALRLKNVSYRYPDGRRAVRDISLDVAAGEKVALAGPNGAGKSTLMLQLNGLLAGEGEIEVGALPVAEPHLPLIRSKVGVVFQNPDDQLFSPTVFEDVAFGPLHMGLAEEEVGRRVERALSAVDMAGYGDRQPYHLSVGEKKRVALATVLAMDAEILVLDEPSAGLDPRARRALIALLQRLPQTMIIATHDMRLIAALCPRLVIMDEGRIVADGPTTDLLAASDLLEAHGLEQP